MSSKKEIPPRAVLDRIADESGVAIAVVDRSGIEVSLSNDNSICRSLNPDGEFCRECSAFCGRALDEATEAGAAIDFTCHAGLDCRAAAMSLDGKPAAVIVGRAFTRAENYRKATERAMSGDWSSHSPSGFFANILLAGSVGGIQRTMERVESEAGPMSDPIADEQPIPKPSAGMADEIAMLADRINRMSESGHPAEPEPYRNVNEAASWRSFFSSLLDNDHHSACAAILDFVATQYALDSIVWLVRDDGAFNTLTGRGELAKRKIRLGIPADDERFLNAVRDELPVELAERNPRGDDSQRTMLLFPVPVGGEVHSALGILDDVSDIETRHQIARLCQSVAPQLEILRLRGEVTKRETLSSAVRRFSDGLKQIDGDDFWLRLTQIAAEMMQAERGSILVVDESSGELRVRAAVGAREPIAPDDPAGARVARIVLERGEPTVVRDVAKAGLPPFPPERGYKTSSFMSIPLSIAGRQIAVINFTDKAAGTPFGSRDVELIDEISPHIAVAIDRALLKEKAGTFQQLSVTDPLTGLLNRRYIEERLIEEVKRSNRHGYPMSYLSLDVDHFKSYNDQFGHPAGDEALKLVANIIRDTLRGADVAARVGGEEFSILLPQTTNDEAAAIAERLRANVDTAAFPNRKVTVSIGVASCSSELCTTDGIVDASDKALYAAKNTGRNIVRIYDEAAGE